MTLALPLVVSVDTAAASAKRAGWPTRSELLLYVVHGTLHITGMTDEMETDRAQMRVAERSVMLGLGINDIVRFGADQTLPASPNSIPACDTVDSSEVSS